MTLAQSQRIGTENVKCTNTAETESCKDSAEICSAETKTKTRQQRKQDYLRFLMERDKPRLISMFAEHVPPGTILPHSTF